MIRTANHKENAAMGEQHSEPTLEPTGDIVTWGDIILWTVRPASECTLENSDYADFVRRFKMSSFAGEMECPAGGFTLEQLVLASFEVRAARTEQKSEESAAPG
jgi:hypothetical protein